MQAVMPARTADMAHEMGHGDADLAAMVRDMRRRFLICLFFAVPIFVYAPMAGMFKPPAPPFGLDLGVWLFLLATAAIVYPSWPFFVSSWRALRKHADRRGQRTAAQAPQARCRPPVPRRGKPRRASAKHGCRAAGASRQPSCEFLGARMDAERYPFHHRSQVDVLAGADTLFARLDDHLRLAGHMEKPSLMMAGATMGLEADALRGQAVGAVMRLRGRVLGTQLAVDEVVTGRLPPLGKSWETRGEPQLLVIGAYRMGFTISPITPGSLLVVSIDYALPPRGFGHLRGLLFGRTYAAWCTRRMTTDAAREFAGMAGP